MGKSNYHCNFTRRINDDRRTYCKSGAIDGVGLKNKSYIFSFPLPIQYKWFEFQFQWKGNLASMWELYLKRRYKKDHAGIFFSFSMLKLFFLEINIADCRHWDFDN